MSKTRYTGTLTGDRANANLQILRTRSHITQLVAAAAVLGDGKRNAAQLLEHAEQAARHLRMVIKFLEQELDA